MSILLFCAEDVQPNERDNFIRIVEFREKENYVVSVCLF